MLLYKYKHTLCTEESLITLKCTVIRSTARRCWVILNIHFQNFVDKVPLSLRLTYILLSHREPVLTGDMKCYWDIYIYKIRQKWG